jgi:hypothetical protein
VKPSTRNKWASSRRFLLRDNQGETLIQIVALQVSKFPEVLITGTAGAFDAGGLAEHTDSPKVGFPPTTDLRRNIKKSAAGDFAGYDSGVHILFMR